MAEIQEAAVATNIHNKVFVCAYGTVGLLTLRSSTPTTRRYKTVSKLLAFTTLLIATATCAESPLESNISQQISNEQSLYETIDHRCGARTDHFFRVLIDGQYYYLPNRYIHYPTQGNTTEFHSVAIVSEQQYLIGIVGLRNYENQEQIESELSEVIDLENISTEGGFKRVRFEKEGSEILWKGRTMITITDYVGFPSLFINSGTTRC